MDYLDSTVVPKLKFIKRSLFYIDYHNNQKMKSVVHEIDSNSAKKIVTLLKGGSRTLQSTDKVFILKNHDSRIEDLKEYIKQAGAKITSKIDKATVFLTNNNIVDDINSYRSNSKYIHIPNGHNIHVNNSADGSYICRNIGYYYGDLQLTDTKIVDDTAVAYSEEFADSPRSSGSFIDYAHRVKEKDGDCYLTSYAVYIIYHILSQKIPLLNEHYLVNEQSQNNVIDENSYQVLDKMFQGSEEDVLTAQTILYNCNIDKSFYWLKELAHKHCYSIINNRKKAYKAFLSRLNVTHLTEIAFMNTWEFIKECISRDVFYDNVRETLQTKLEEEIKSDFAQRAVREYNDCINIEYNINYNKLIEYVKSK